MDLYDPDIAPDPAAWLALDEQARIEVALAAHEGRFPDALHSDTSNEIMHGSLHAIIETQVASGAPAITAKTLTRLAADGLKRHAAAHMLMHVLAGQLARLGGQDTAYDAQAWARALKKLNAADAVGKALQHVHLPDGDPPLNRTQRRAAARKKKRT